MFRHSATVMVTKPVSSGRLTLDVSVTGLVAVASALFVTDTGIMTVTE
jgi:hypothetical protein